jgi:hypothetical protein
VAGAVVDALCVTVLVARVAQSLVHVAFEQTNTAVSVRFGLFFVQIVGFMALTGVIAREIASAS